MDDLKSALTEYSEKFVATTRKTVDKIENFRKINRCALVYDRGKYTILPPVLGILFDQDFTGVDLECLWNPEEFDVYAARELELSIISSSQEIINQKCRENRRNEDAVVSMLVDSCAEMSRWLRETLKKNDVFFFATDPEMVETKKNVRAINNIVGNVDDRMPDWF